MCYYQWVPWAVRLGGETPGRSMGDLCELPHNYDVSVLGGIQRPPNASQTGPVATPAWIFRFPADVLSCQSGLVVGVGGLPAHWKPNVLVPAPAKRRSPGEQPPEPTAIRDLQIGHPLRRSMIYRLFLDPFGWRMPNSESQTKATSRKAAFRIRRGPPDMGWE